MTSPAPNAPTPLTKKQNTVNTVVSASRSSSPNKMVEEPFSSTPDNSMNLTPTLGRYLPSSGDATIMTREYVENTRPDMVALTPLSSASKLVTIRH